MKKPSTTAALRKFRAAWRAAAKVGARDKHMKWKEPQAARTTKETVNET